MKVERNYKIFFSVADVLSVFVIPLQQKKMLSFTWSHASSSFLLSSNKLKFFRDF